MHTLANVPINTLAKLIKTPTLMNQEVHNPSDGGFTMLEALELNMPILLHIEMWQKQHKRGIS